MRRSLRSALAALFLAACGSGDNRTLNAGSGVSDAAATGASSGAAMSGSGTGATSGTGTTGAAGSPDAATTGSSSGTASSGASTCPASLPAVGSQACSGTTVCQYGHASCCGIASSFMTCKCQFGQFNCYQTVECNFACAGPSDASSDADSSTHAPDTGVGDGSSHANDTGAGDGAVGTPCGVTSECASGLLCCYPCGIPGCHNQCTQVPQGGQCPLLP